MNNVNWLKIHRKMKALTIAYSTNAIKHVRKEFNPFKDDISSFSNVENITRACEPWVLIYTARRTLEKNLTFSFKNSTMISKVDLTTRHAPKINVDSFDWIFLWIKMSFWSLGTTFWCSTQACFEYEKNVVCSTCCHDRIFHLIWNFLQKSSLYEIGKSCKN